MVQEQRRQELDAQSKFGSPTAWGSVIGAIGAAACQLVAGTVLVMLTRVGSTLTQWRQADIERIKEADRLGLLQDITNVELREQTIAAYITSSPINKSGPAPTKLKTDKAISDIAEPEGK